MKSVLVLATVLVLGAGLAAAERSERDRAAIDAAERWLALVDAAEYRQSWEQAAALFKGAVTAEQWEASIRGARGPLGRLVSREIVSARFETSLPGAPDGEYVVIQCRASYENKAEAIETVTPMRDGAAWRVSGYYIR